MNAHRYPTPPISSPGLVLCADGGGSKISVVIRSADGVEVKGFAGPCNVRSIGFGPAIQAILLATYRALEQLPKAYLPDGFKLPAVDPSSASSRDASPGNFRSIPTSLLVGARFAAIPLTPYPSRPSSPPLLLPPLSHPVFEYAWLGLAGVNSAADERAFKPFVLAALGLTAERVKVTNDVNLLAAPALALPGIEHVAAVVCGTGTVGRTIKVQSQFGRATSLPIEDVGMSGGWGYVLDDEGSAFYIGRLAIRLLLAHSDREASSAIYSLPAPTPLPLHQDLLAYFGVQHADDLIGIAGLTAPFADGMSIGSAVSKRNALMAGAARIVLGWAFPDERTPPSDTSAGHANGPSTASPPSPVWSDRNDDPLAARSRSPDPGKAGHQTGSRAHDELARRQDSRPAGEHGFGSGRRTLDERGIPEPAEGSIGEGRSAIRTGSGGRRCGG